ncbi:uncharacterized protein K02A2.6-like [Macrosteles quadrilineatus]|uniref:uncharacterized protein K02A2.6-like n=1 Tax=Macrosteles quadrilineatus TaxID=74068 RepID=UPI0023E17AB1|nr:uncharacterized protein K02A2.6-like [Macrosteles quadrilineatus]
MDDVRVKEVLKEFEDVFSEGHGKIKGYKARIHVREDANPQHFSARRVPFPLKKRIENELTRLVNEDIIEEVDPAATPIPWATPTVNVEKNYGSIRICGDLRVTLNQNLVPENAIIPTFEELTNKVAGGQEFSKIDLRDAYLQMEVVEEHRKYLVIATHSGYYKYKRLPFGISSSPGIFQRYMERLLAGIPQVGVLLDDIIITGRNKNEHLRNLREVLKRMKEAGIKAKSSKCKFFEESVTYLGHTIDRNGIHPTEEKIKAIREARSPTKVKELRSFLGSINYYERFIPGLHAICSDLHKLTGTKSQWKWSNQEEGTFKRVKEILSSKDTVVPYEEMRPLVMVCDASENGLGSVLMHRYEDGLERPIAFASRTLLPAEKQYSNIDREALAIMFGLRKFHQYVYGRKFTLVTDHKPLQRIFGNMRDLPKVLNNRLVRWALQLNQYNYDIEYRKEEDNVCADVLSRLPIEDYQPEEAHIGFLNVDKVNSIMSYDLLKQNSFTDKAIKMAKNFVLRNTWPPVVPEMLKSYKQRKDELSVEDDILLWFGRIVVPECMRTDVLKILHTGHPGIVSMRSVARHYVWWPNMDKDIEVYIKRCTSCPENRDNVEEVPLYPWNVPDRVWERVHIDLAGPVNGSMWLVGIDALSKWAEVDCLKTTNSSTIIQRLRSW